MTDLANTLDSVERFVRRFVAFPSQHEPVAVAIFVVHTHLVDEATVRKLVAA